MRTRLLSWSWSLPSSTSTSTSPSPWPAASAIVSILPSHNTLGAGPKLQSTAHLAFSRPILVVQLQLDPSAISRLHLCTTSRSPARPGALCNVEPVHSPHHARAERDSKGLRPLHCRCLPRHRRASRPGADHRPARHAVPIRLLRVRRQVH
jgi:hypothetical protein